MQKNKISISTPLLSCFLSPVQPSESSLFTRLHASLVFLTIVCGTCHWVKDQTQVNPMWDTQAERESLM